MNKLTSWLVLLIGIILLLPLITLDIGIAGPWIIAVAVIIIGLLLVTKK